ncbi:MAG: glycoside hydrolase family 3 C-terminal domain-containing protein [Bacteroidetes bacterium]|nr:glycoside hydrolase family 3 C-terminal domain-containing protein [Bacteroidota bacterium]MDA0943391.1 glycoside hydrolase family 3 C-terminal domain-containing protein [Bacteroidota bacterium]MDA1111750.1 glycoside hydrolase family 3 C-terminal domain-containing protein [Bacteroidota bacterium]
MKRFTAGLLFLLSAQAAWSQVSKIDSLISQMTLVEKVGQMTQIDLSVIVKGGYCNPVEPLALDEAALQKAFGEYKVGSVLNCACASGSKTVETWNEIINSIQASARLHGALPVLYGIDAIHGTTYTSKGTLFPQPLGQAATWNPRLVEQGAAITAYETRASGIPWNFSPVLDLGRQPLWSRMFETYGEDVYLTTQMGLAAVRGYQGPNESIDDYHVAACLKHFLGYSATLSGKDRTPAYLAERDWRDLYLPPFQAAIEAGARTIMVNSGEISGIPVHANPRILSDLLRDELGFEGVVVTDWEDIYKLHVNHRVASDFREAVKLAILAGVDMSMTPNDYRFNDHLIDLVQSGEISMERIDASVRRILTLKEELDLIEPSAPTTVYTQFASPAFQQAALQAARESMTLLKNESALPLGSGQHALVGPVVESLTLINGAWTHTWLGRDEGAAQEHGLGMTLAAASQKYAPEGRYTCPKFSGYYLSKKELKALKSCESIVVCLGETPGTEVPGNTESLDLSREEIDYVKSLASLGKPLTLVLFFNRPRIISELEPLAQAIIHAYLPGDYGPQALIETLEGENNPSGKLPITYPRSSGSIVHYDRKHTEDFHSDYSTNAYQPQYDFGHGLSYTQFTHSALTLDTLGFASGKPATATWTITNAGSRAGQEVAQLYMQDLYASVSPSVRKLIGFQKVLLAPGESVDVHFAIKRDDLSLVNAQNVRLTEAGDFEIWGNNGSRQTLTVR